MKYIFRISILAFLFSTNMQTAEATPQAGDLLIYKGKTLNVFYFILDKYMHEFPDKRDAFYKKNHDLMMYSTGCWRGYQALFIIKNDSLFLKKVYGLNQQEMDITPLFGKQENVFFSWYTGALTNFQNCILYIENGYYEYETDFIFKNGILQKIEKFQNTIKPSVYTEESTLTNYIQSHINYKNITPIDQEVVVITSLDDVDENGKITEVSILRGYNDEYDQEAIRVVKSIPQWQYIKRRNKKVHIYWTIPVKFKIKKQAL